MDAGLLWTAIGSLAGALASAIAWRQYRLDVRHRPTSRRPAPGGSHGIEVQGASVRPPTGRLPKVRGRDQIMGELSRLLRRPRGHFVVLSSMGGVGKSTVALSLAARAMTMRLGVLRRKVDVWWVSVADPASLTSAMAKVAAELGAPETDLEAIALGRPDGPDRLWARLERAPRRWLLVLDNADDPDVLARPVRPTGTPEAAPADAVADGHGWARPSRRGLVVVTSRDASRRTWGRHARVVDLEPLDEDAAARVLLDWAPAAGTEAEAAQLAERLGRLPLALELAGSYLESEVALTPSFVEYERSLDRRQEASHLLASEPGDAADPRRIVMRTWELSLDALAQRGVPQARPLLRLLSCFAASTPIPLDLLDPAPLARLLAASREGATATQPAATATAVAARDLDVGLRHLRRYRLIEAGLGAQDHMGPERSVAVHPLIADTNRAHLGGDAADLDPALIRRTAADLVIHDLGRLFHDEPADWPRYQVLAPHLHALMDTVAPHLDDGQLGALLAATAWASAAHDRLGDVAAGERLSRDMLEALSPLSDDDPAALLVRHMLAWETAFLGRLRDADAMITDVLARRERVLKPDHPDTLATLHEKAWIAGAFGRWAEAETLYRDVLARRTRVLGAEHYYTLMSRHELAWVIASQGRGAEAEGILREVIEARSRTLRPDHPRTLASRQELAWAIAVQERWAEAEAEYRDVLGARRQILGIEHHETLTTAHELAWTISMQGRHRHREARARYEEVLAARERALGPSHPDTEATLQALERLRAGLTTPAHHLA